MAVVSNTGAAVHGGLSVHVRPVIGVSIVASLMKMQMWCVFTVKIDYDSLLPWLTPKSFMTIYVRRKYQSKMSNKRLSLSVNQLLYQLASHEYHFWPQSPRLDIRKFKLNNIARP